MAAAPEDSFSCMPQELCRYIVSLLPMDDSVRLSILSRRWRETWYSCPNLFFNYREFPEMEEKQEIFVDFIQQTLARHDMSTIENFEISMPLSDIDKGVETEWIVFAILHNALNLFLCGKMEELQRLPDSLFLSKSLTKIDFVLPGYVLERPEKVFLPNLKELRLRAIVIADCLQETLEGCPALEYLWLLFCDITLLKTLIISCSSLKQFTISHCEGIENCLLRLQTPMLKNFRMVDHTALDYEFLNNSSPQFGCISFEDPYPLEKNMGDFSKAAFGLYRGLKKVKVLFFNPWFIEFLSWDADLQRQLRITSFNNLECLNPFMWPIKSHIEIMMLILSKTPNLCRLEIIMVRTIASASNELLLPDLENKKFSCILNHLTHVSIDRFEGNTNELELVRFLLENAPSLIKLKLSKEYGYDDSDTEDFVGFSVEIRKKIRQFKRLSKNAVVAFS